MMIRADRFLQALLERFKKPFRGYIEIALEETARVLLMFVSTTALNMALLYSIKAFWGIYSGTVIGQRFIARGGDLYLGIMQLLEQNPFDFSLQITTHALLACLAISLFSQFCYIRHLLYSSQNILVKSAWVFVVAYLVAEQIQMEMDFSPWRVAYFIGLPSTFALLAGSMTLAGRVIPEAGTIFIAIYNKIRGWI